MRNHDPKLRIAITGVGILCSIGRNASEVWESIVQSRSGIRPMTRFPGETFPTSIAAEVLDEIYAMTGEARSRLRRLSRTDVLAVAAAREALAQAESGTTPLDRDRMIVSTGTSTGGLLEGEDFFFRRLIHGRGRTPTSRVLQQPTSGPSDAVANIFGLGGGVVSNATACASAGAAIGLAADLLRSGHARSVIAGGSDALCRLTYSGFNVLQAVDPSPCTPFSAERKGISLGEGAAYLVLEPWHDAIERGAAILAELCGYGASCDAHHLTAPAEDGRGAAAAMRGAIASAGLDAREIDYINAHGTGTLLNDSAESHAIVSVVGAQVPVSSTKSYFGHTLGASGALEAVISVLALIRQIAPPTLRLRAQAVDCELDCIPETPRPMDLHHVLSNTFGFGGSNISLLFRSVTPR
ncbi:MAG TPA: beta-ketoacyl-[acyl-carrier-protein] synthase family protein [Thermoanaerobaculia bacterium]|nr:beta-ketoacyl-[acyl-carrier-protein] synthase family protein [Thermoanaerobaculia bacterium]